MNLEVVAACLGWHVREAVSSEDRTTVLIALPRGYDDPWPPLHGERCEMQVNGMVEHVDTVVARRVVSLAREGSAEVGPALLNSVDYAIMRVSA